VAGIFIGMDSSETSETKILNQSANPYCVQVVQKHFFAASEFDHLPHGLISAKAE
jgi:hypothetical protein